MSGNPYNPHIRPYYVDDGSVLPPNADPAAILAKLQTAYKVSSLRNCEASGSCAAAARELYNRARKDGLIVSDPLFQKMAANYALDLKNSKAKNDTSEATIRRLNLKQMYLDSYLVGKILSLYRYPPTYIVNMFGTDYQRSIVNYLDQIEASRTFPETHTPEDLPTIVQTDENIQLAIEAAERLGISRDKSALLVPRILRIFWY